MNVATAIEQIQHAVQAEIQHAKVRLSPVLSASTICSLVFGSHDRWAGSGRCKRCGKHRDPARASG